jgi:hypothetical protein
VFEEGFDGGAAFCYDYNYFEEGEWQGGACRMFDGSPSPCDCTAILEECEFGTVPELAADGFVARAGVRAPREGPAQDETTCNGIVTTRYYDQDQATALQERLRLLQL